MSKHRKSLARHASVSFVSAADLRRMASGRWMEILQDAGLPIDALQGRKGRPCPRCGGCDRFAPLKDVVESGAVLCRHCFNGSTEPRCGDGIATLRWWLGLDVSGALRWLQDWLSLGIASYWIGPSDNVAEPELPPSVDRKRFELMASVWHRNMRPSWQAKAARLLGLPCEPLVLLQVGWAPEHRATSWPMRDASDAIVGLRLRCPKTAKKWAVTGSQAGLFFAPGQIGSGRWFVCEGPTDTAALLSVGLQVVGVPSAGGGRDALVELCRRLRPDELVMVADADGPGVEGARRIADAVMMLARVRMITPGNGCKDARAWIVAGADRAVVEATADGSQVQSIVMEGC